MGQLFLGISCDTRSNNRSKQIIVPEYNNMIFQIKNQDQQELTSLAVSNSGNNIFFCIGTKVTSLKVRNFLS